MSKKTKLDLSGEGLKKLAINHCEKAVFGVCGVLLLLLAYWGYQSDVFDEKKDNPTSLIDSAKRSENRIQNTKWEDSDNEEMSFAKHRVADETISGKVEKINAVMADAGKFPSYPTGEISLSVKPKRTNPTILAATDLQAKFGYQLIALNPGVFERQGSDAINREIFAPKPKKKEKKKKKKKSSGKNGSDSSSSSSGMEEPPSGDSGESSPGAGGMSPPGGGGTGTGGPTGPVKPDYPVHEAPPTMLAEIEGVPLAGMIPGKKEGGKFAYPAVLWRQVVCVTAVVPYKKQLAAYEETLQGSRKYDPNFDIPKYLGLLISRRVNGGEWTDITNQVQDFSKLVQTVYYPNLVADKEFDPFLNAPVPAFLLNDFDSFVLHPKSELRDFLKKEAPKKDDKSADSSSSAKSSSLDDLGAANDPSDGETAEEKQPELAPTYLTSETAPEFKQVRFFDVLLNINPGDKVEYRVNVVLSNPNLPLSFLVKTKKVAGSGNMGMGGGSGGSGGSGDIFDSDSGPAAAGGNAGGGGSGGASTRGGSSSSSSSVPSNPGGGAGGGYMGGGGNAPGQSAADKIAKLALEMLGNPRISDADLDGSIRADILKFKDQEPPKLTDRDLIRQYGMVSPVSDASNVVEFTVPGERFVTGGAPPLPIRRANNVEFYDSDPAAELVILKRDDSLQLEVPGRASVFAGTPLVFDAKAEVFNPLDWTIRWVGPPTMDDEGKEDPEKRGNYKFNSSAIVLDVSPSRSLDNVTDLKEEFLSPAEVLLFDGSGFSLRNELDDLKDFRHATFAGSEMASGEESETSDIGGFGDFFDNEDPVGAGNSNK